jgi:signal transduction histidine kinase
MLPEFSLKKVKLKVSTDSTSLITGYVIFATAIAWYILARDWQHTSLIGFFILAGLILAQFLFLRLPQTKTIEFFNSGGIVPLVIYNVALAGALVLYVPLYSPFLLLMPGIIFLTVYYRGTITTILSIIELIAIVVIGTLLQGLPHEPYSIYYPYIIIVIGIAYTVNVSRAGSIENGVRLELGRVATQVFKERQQLSTLINSIGDAVVATDITGNILFYNAGALALLNTQAVTIGQPFSQIVKLYDEAGQWVNLLALVNDKSTQMQFNRFHILPSDNENEHIELAIDVSRIAADPNAKQESGLIFLMRDITKEKSLDQERDEFISVTSHELRTPITLVEADISLALLKQEGSPPLPPIVKQQLEKAHESILYLANLTNQLITISEAEKNNLQIISAPVDLKLLVKELETKYRALAKTKGLAFTAKLAPQVTTITTSRLYLGEILENFLSNAVKYTEKGAIALVIAPSENSKNLVFSVEDTGIGISISDKTKIFEKFYRSEDFHTRETGGAGLGLYMSRKLAGYLGAKIDFESKLNKGSVFHLTLKL